MGQVPGTGLVLKYKKIYKILQSTVFFRSIFSRQNISNDKKQKKRNFPKCLRFFEKRYSLPQLSKKPWSLLEFAAVWSSSFCL